MADRELAGGTTGKNEELAGVAGGKIALLIER